MNVTEADWSDIVDLSIDVGVHAGQEACSAIARTAESLPSSVHKVMATIIAFSYIQAKLDVMRKETPELVAMLDELNEHLRKG